MPDDFDPNQEPLRAIRDLIGACELCSFFGPDFGEAKILDRAQAAFTTLRAIFGDTRPAEDIADGPMIEPGYLTAEIARRAP